MILRRKIAQILMKFFLNFVILILCEGRVSSKALQLIIYICDIFQIKSQQPKIQRNQTHHLFIKGYFSEVDLSRVFIR